MEELRAKDASLAKAWINTALLAALLADADADLAAAAAQPDGADEAEDPAACAQGPAFPPEPEAGPAIPLWRLAALAVLRLTLTVLGPLPATPPDRAILRRLAETPRRRRSIAHRRLC